MSQLYASAPAAVPTPVPVPSAQALDERRTESREDLHCDLWMIDHHGCTVLRCQVLDVAPNGIRLKVPLGYGVAEGQRYELRSHMPGARNGPSLGIIGSRWGTVVRTRLVIGDGDDFLEAGLVLDTADSTSLRVVGSF